MKSPASASPWQPLTFGGVAAFASGTLRRFVIVQAIMAGIVALVTVWFLVTTCFPVIDTAVRRLPEQGGIQRGQLVWGGPSPLVLGESEVVALAINAEEPRSPGTTADLEILLAPQGIRFSSLLGHWTLPYLRGYGMDLTRKNLESWWDAWSWALVVCCLTLGTASIMVLWSLAAVITCLPVRALGRALGRSLTTRGAWQLAVAAGYPGTLVLTAALVLYGLGQFPLLGLLLAWLFHFVLLGVYLFLAPWCLPRQAAAGSRANPFTSASSSRGKGARRRNPFAASR